MWIDRCCGSILGDGFAAAKAMHGFAFGFPLHLEVGFWIEEGVFGPFEAFELGKGIDLLAAPLEVFLMIGHEEEFAAWL